jgi:predicted MPP superfamily phosphohydrolase
MKIMPYIILTAFLAILITSIIYMSRKFSWSFGLESARPLYILFSVLPVLFFTGGVVFMNSTGTLEHILYKVSFVTMGVYLFMLMSVITVDLANIFIKLKPQIFGLTVIVLTTLISVGGYFNSMYLRDTKLNITVEGLTEEINAVHLTDIHIGHFRTNGFLDKLVDKTNAQDPDLILLTGDYLDSKYALKPEYFNPLKRLKAPVYFVDGNHDHSTHNDSIVALMKKAGVNVLDNQVANYKQLQIVGLTHMIADRATYDMHASGNNPTIQETLPTLNIDKNRPSILLHHAPNGIKYASEAGIDLYLAGHTHAGQIFPFNLIAKMIFDYNSGLHTYNKTKIFVSEGVGTFGPPFRIGTRSEIISIKLTPHVN